MSVSYLSELSDQLRASVSTFRLPDRASDKIEVFPSMNGMPALPTAPERDEQFYQQDMSLSSGWNQNFSSDFLSLPQPQGADASGFQFAFNGQQNFANQPGMPQLSVGVMNGGQLGFESQGFGNFSGQPNGDMHGFNGQQFTGIPESGYGHQGPPMFSAMPPQNFGLPPQPGFESASQGFGGQQGFGSSPNFGGQQGFGSAPQGFGGQQGFGSSSQSFGGQQGFGPPQQGFGGPPQGSGMPPQNFVPPPGNQILGRTRWQDGQQQQGAAAFSPEQVPFPGPGNGYKG